MGIYYMAPLLGPVRYSSISNMYQILLIGVLYFVSLLARFLVVF